MSQFPALPLFVREYRMDTLHLTTEQHGAYLLLLMQAWCSPQARLPDCDEKLAAWAGLDLARWRALRPVLEPFFAVRGGWWTQKRLSKEWHFVRSKLAARRESGRNGGEASARKRRELGDAAKRRDSNGLEEPYARGSLNDSSSDPRASTPTHSLSITTDDSAEGRARCPTAIFGLLVEAAGGNVEQRTQGITTIKPILDLIAQGCDLDADVLPAIRQGVRTLQSPLRTWAARWLQDAILTKRDMRLVGPRVVAGPPSSPSPRTTRNRVRHYFERGWWQDEAR